jgi:hypothetical protein
MVSKDYNSGDSVSITKPAGAEVMMLCDVLKNRPLCRTLSFSKKERQSEIDALRHFVKDK